MSGRISMGGGLRRQKLRDRRGFTMIELLVTIGILALIMAIAIPSYLRMTRSAAAIKCTGKLHAIGVGLSTYLIDSGAKMPVMASSRDSKKKPTEIELPTIDLVLAEYINDEEAFHCPSDHRLFAKTGSSYFWNSVVNGQPTGALNFLGLTKSHSGIPLVSDKENFHEHIGDGVNILYADGHVQKELQFIVDAP
jgi:prepilin-type N-terminal cleavage/methylation domain-containing protein/prepilin-type processing-associated H-X9-DG protein